MNRPRIGISMDTSHPDERRALYQLNADYANSVFRAGGMPIPLPHTHDNDIRLEIIASLDGLIIPGGGDIDPKLYGQRPHPKCDPVDPLRQAFDLAMLSLAEQRGLPVLGICLGSQLMNVQRRGTLHQHLPEAMPESQVRHSKPGLFTNSHEVTIRANTRLAVILGEGILIANSRHHQGIDRLGHGLVVTATAPDGLVEAFEDPTLPFWLAVQWHPENMENTPHQKLFVALVEAARKAAHH